MNNKREFGDFQTPDWLAKKVVSILSTLHGTPDTVVEPNVGLGSFLNASYNEWGESSRYEGYEINRDYVNRTSSLLKGCPVSIYHADFFTVDWGHKLKRGNNELVFVIGNPPWVTNSDLGQLESQNLPTKTNFQRLRGLDARMGKANFDIAEWMLIQLIEALPTTGVMAMLCKTATARRVLRHFWKIDRGRGGSRLFRIDAKAAFNVSVDACLFIISGQISADRRAAVYSDLDLNSEMEVIGYVDGNLVSDMLAYQEYRQLDGGTAAYTWRSGLKHDAAKVMEFSREGDLYRNGLGESVQLEDNYLYPLLKSSDLGNNRVQIRRYVLVTQSHIGEDTRVLEASAPRIWDYLTRHSNILDQRKSSIYVNRPRFSIFGIGPYSFMLWKVAVSGFYKSFNFVVVPPFCGKPVMIDDTCYSISCDSQEEALYLHELLSSEPARAFFRSLVFTDTKRPITIDVLRRLSLVALADRLGRLDELEHFVQGGKAYERASQQMSLLMESKRGLCPLTPPTAGCGGEAGR